MASHTNTKIGGGEARFITVHLGKRKKAIFCQPCCRTLPEVLIHVSSIRFSICGSPANTEFEYYSVAYF